MKIQRILQASKTTEGREHQIVLCYTSRKEFVVWSYFEDTKYSGGCYHQTFLDGLRDFRKHVKDTFGEHYVFDYVAKQIGQVEIVWEELESSLVTIWELENLQITGNAHHDQHILSGCYKIVLSSCPMVEKIRALRLVNKVMGNKYGPVGEEDVKAILQIVRSE